MNSKSATGSIDWNAARVTAYPDGIIPEKKQILKGCLSERRNRSGVFFPLFKTSESK